MELKNVTEWLKMNKLSLNVNKTKAMLFHMQQKKIILEWTTSLDTSPRSFICVCVFLCIRGLAYPIVRRDTIERRLT